MSRLFVALILSLSFATAAQAQTVGYADAVRLLANACGNDIQRYCSTARLANFGIGRCLNENQGNISGQCATTLVDVRNSLAARAEAQATAEKVCNTDIRRLCPMTKPGRGNILRCLLKAEPSASNKCNQAITNAGWR